MDHSNLPTELLIDNSALKHLQVYLGDKTPTEAIGGMLVYHRQHIAAELQNIVEYVGMGGGMFLTDIPDSELALLEVRMGDESSIGLYSKDEAREIAITIMNALGLQSDDEPIQ